MGGTFMSVTPDILSGVLGVAGAPFSLLLPRSQDFSDFDDIFKIKYANPLDRIFLITFFQQIWDRYVSTSWVYSSYIPPALPLTPTCSAAVLTLEATSTPSTITHCPTLRSIVPLCSTTSEMHKCRGSVLRRWQDPLPPACSPTTSAKTTRSSMASLSMLGPSLREPTSRVGPMTCLLFLRPTFRHRASMTRMSVFDVILVRKNK
jgi:hypothetical protein